MFDRLEVIVVSDGHDEATEALLKGNAFQVPVTFFEIPKSQQGVARNRGVERARAPVTLYIGDDMFLAPDACAAHLRVHEESNGRPRAVLGHIAWDPKVGITAAMEWLDRTGWQFGFGLLASYVRREVPAAMQHRFTYTGNISLPTTLAKRFPFREDIALYGWEDTEWGLRLAEAGIPLFYEPEAQALHHHRMTLEDSLRRMETLGRSARIVERMNPQLHLVPSGWKKSAYALIARLPTMRGKHAKAFLRGLTA